MTKRRVGIIGCGTIGSQLAIAIDNGEVKNASIVSLFDVAQETVLALREKLNSHPAAFSKFDNFIKNTQCDIIVEAASQEAVRKYAMHVLRARKDLIVMSVGGLADKSFLSELIKESEGSVRRLYVPTGAIAGIDAIRAVKDLLDSVMLITTKNPKALAGAPFFENNKLKLEDVKERRIIYEGSASDAVKAFPANVNVAAVLSLAGLGLDRTKVRIIADPSFATNQHEILARGSFGEFRFTVNNVPSPGNPKTSYLAVLSAIECLRSVCGDGIRIGS